MTEKVKKEESAQGSDIRYKYIGFDVYGSKVKEFFRSDDEKKQYEKQVAEYADSHFSSLRSGTAVQAELLSMTDRIVLTLSSLCLIIGSIMPWFVINSIYGQLKITGITTFSAVAGVMDVASEFSDLLPLLAYLFTGLAAVSLVLGVLSLIMLYLPSKDRAKHLARLKHALGWQYLPLTVWIGTFIFLIVGISIPFGKDLADIYSISGLSDKFNIVTFWVFAQPALWLTIGGLVVNAVKSNDL